MQCRPILLVLRTAPAAWAAAAVGAAVRGGCRVSYRTFGYPSDRSSFLGFRVALLP